MKCKYSEQDIALYVEGDLTEVHAQDINAHLEACEHCRTVEHALRDSQSIFKSVRQESVDTAALAEVRNRILAEVSGLSSRTPWGRKVERWLWLGLRRGYALAGVGLAVLLGVALWYLGLETQKPAEVTSGVAVLQPNVPEVAEIRTPAVPAASRPARRPVRSRPAVPVSLPALDQPASEEPQQLVMKLLTDDPNIVIYWLVDKNGD